jgi:DNA polymerase/3'-5' exonuclease PolX
VKLADAQKVAEGVALLFEPFCERIEIAGSIRRQRPECGDVDLVVIPKIREHRDLLGNIDRRENLLLTNLIQYVRDNARSVRWKPILRGGNVVTACEPRPEAQCFSIEGRHAQIDFFVATPATWATTLLTRTGSKEHNIWISNRAIAKRGKFLASEGLWFSGRGAIHPQSEAEFYELLGLPFIEPKLRERMHLMRLDTEEACR